jgi:phosphoglycerol transferase MdoB-like AlkP superfamily enzyme
MASIIVKQLWVLHRSGAGATLGGLCFTAASALVIGLLVVALPQRIRPWAAWATAMIATVFLFGDLVHLRFFGDLGSAAALRSAGQLGQVGGSVVSLLRLGDLWFWTDLVAAAAMALVVSRSKDRDLPRQPVLLAGVVASVVLFGLGAVLLDRSVSIRQVFHSTQLARQIGVVNLHLFDAWDTLRRGLARPPLSDAAYEEVVAFFDDRRDSRAGVGPTFGIARGRNLVMIQVESLQAFVVGLRIGGREVTPTLNSLAASSFTFTNVTDQTEEGRSSDSELATQVSLLPPDRGAAAFLYPGNRFTGVASVLREHGYETLSAVPFDGAFWNRRSTHPAYGYDESLFESEFAPGESIGWGLNDRDFLVQAADRLADLGPPWCAYLLTLSLHHPFDGFPDRFKRLDVGRWEGTPFGNYLHTMHHFDVALGDFLGALDRRGLTASTVIALWGDHDAGFEWSSEIAEAMGATHDPAGWYLSQRVPLVIHVSGEEEAAVVSDRPAGHIDVAPTLLHVLGVDPAPYPFVGRNLLGKPGSGAVVGEYRCWRDDTVLYLRRGPDLDDGECIALDTMEEVDAGLCAAGFDDAARQVENSRLVLGHDLQQKLRQSLAGRP